MKKIIVYSLLLTSLGLATYFLINKKDDNSGSQELIITYPYSNSVFPADITAPTFIWTDSTKDVNKWQISASQGDVILLKNISVKERTWRPSTSEWRLIIDNSLNKDVTVSIKGYQKNRALSGSSVVIKISEDKVEAPIFYRAVPLPFKFARENLKKVRWHMGSVSEEAQPHIMLDNIPVCANCHSFTANGKTLAMDVDARDDKGAYAISTIEKEIDLNEDSIIHWSDFQEGKFTYGLLSRVSPDGRYVVSTLRDCEIFIDRKDLEYSQLFFPFKGILSVYDRVKKEYFELEGANDTMLVQSNPCWSPDGKYIYFTRAKARHSNESGIHNGSVPKKKDARVYKIFEGHYLNRDTLMKFDIYRIPFNNGKGGKAEPVLGASQNGYSNYFPKISHDGKWLVFTRAESFMLLQKDSKLFIVPAEGGKEREMTCNTGNMNSWHSWSPNSKWLVFSTKALSPYTQFFLTHINSDGTDSPPVYLEKFSFDKYANNIPEFVNIKYDKHIKINPTFLSDNDFLIRAGEIKQKEGDLTSAFQTFDKAVKTFPKQSEPYFKRGRIYFERNQLDLALKDFNKAISIDQNAIYYTSRGSLYLKRGNINKAIADLNKSIELDPTNYEPYTHLGLVFINTKEYAKAKENLSKSIRIYRDDAITNYYLGVANFLTKDYDMAKVSLSNALKLNPDKQLKILAFKMRGKVHLLLGEMSAAVNDYDMVINSSPNDSKAYYMKGRALIDLNYKKDGYKNLRIASQLGSVEARKFLSKNKL